MANLIILNIAPIKTDIFNQPLFNKAKADTHP